MFEKVLLGKAKDTLLIEIIFNRRNVNVCLYKVKKVHINIVCSKNIQFVRPKSICYR